MVDHLNSLSGAAADRIRNSHQDKTQNGLHPSLVRPDAAASEQDLVLLRALLILFQVVAKTKQFKSLEREHAGLTIVTALGSLPFSAGILVLSSRYLLTHVEHHFQLVQITLCQLSALKRDFADF